MPWYEISYTVAGVVKTGIRQDIQNDPDMAFIQYRLKALRMEHPKPIENFDCKRLSEMRPIVVAIKMRNVAPADTYNSVYAEFKKQQVAKPKREKKQSSNNWGENRATQRKKK